MKPRDPAWKPAKYDPADVEALKALGAGVANEGQQKRALKWIIENAAETYEQSFRSDRDGGERDTSFALGRQYVGQQVVKMINMPGNILDEMRRKHD